MFILTYIFCAMMYSFTINVCLITNSLRSQAFYSLTLILPIIYWNVICIWITIFKIFTEFPPISKMCGYKPWYLFSGYTGSIARCHKWNWSSGWKDWKHPFTSNENGDEEYPNRQGNSKIRIHTWINNHVTSTINRYQVYKSCELVIFNIISWWRHQMETFPALLAICAGNSPVPVTSPHKGQWRGTLTFSLICAWIKGWVNNREAGDLRRHSAHYDVILMLWILQWSWHTAGPIVLTGFNL